MATRTAQTETRRVRIPRGALVLSEVRAAMPSGAEPTLVQVLFEAPGEQLDFIYLTRWGREGPDSAWMLALEEEDRVEQVMIDGFSGHVMLSAPREWRCPDELTTGPCVEVYASAPAEVGGVGLRYSRQSAEPPDEQVRRLLGGIRRAYADGELSPRYRRVLAHPYAFDLPERFRAAAVHVGYEPHPGASANRLGLRWTPPDIDSSQVLLDELPLANDVELPPESIERTPTSLNGLPAEHLRARAEYVSAIRELRPPDEGPHEPDTLETAVEAVSVVVPSGRRLHILAIDTPSDVFEAFVASVRW